MSKAGLLVLLGLAACRPATEIVVEVRSDLCPSLKSAGVGVVVAGRGAPDAPASTAEGCGVDGYVGRLVVAPAGPKNEEVEIVVAAGTTIQADGCFGASYDAASCVVARRSLRFREGSSLVVPVSLDKACVGVGCAAGYTCSAGVCISEVVTCEDTGTCAVLAEDAGTTPEPADAGTCSGRTDVQPNAAWPVSQGGCSARTSRTGFRFASGPGSFEALPLKSSVPITFAPVVTTKSIAFLDQDALVEIDLATKSAAKKIPFSTPRAPTPLAIRDDGLFIFRSGDSGQIVGYRQPNAKADQIFGYGPIAAPTDTSDPVLGDKEAFVADAKVFHSLGRDLVPHQMTTWLLSAAAQHAPSIAPNGVLVVATIDGSVHFFDPSMGTEKGMAAPGKDVPLASPVLGDDATAFVIAGLKPTLFAISSTSFLVSWKQDGWPCRVPPSLDAKGDVVVLDCSVAGKTGYRVLAAADGSELGRSSQTLDGGPAGPAIVDVDGTIAWLTVSGHAGSSKNSGVLALPGTKKMGPAAVLPDGRLVAGDDQGQLWLLTLP